MKMLSDDDLDLRGLSDDELAKAWDLWFDLAQHTNDHDPPCTHGAFVWLRREDLEALARPEGADRTGVAGAAQAVRAERGVVEA